MEKIKIRIAVPSDLTQLTELSVLFSTHFCRLEDANDDVMPFEECKAQILELNFAKNPLMRTLVAEKGHRLCGAISFYPGFTVDTGLVYHLPYFLIRPEYRGSRVALMLLEAVKILAYKENIKAFVFSVYGKNKNAVKLYEHMGARYWADNDEHFMYFNL